MDINCERIHLKRIVSVSIAILIYILGEQFGRGAFSIYSFPIIILFATNQAFSYLSIFNRKIHISRDDRYLVVDYGNKTKSYEHNQQEKIILIEASALANYDELIIFLPKKELHFVLSVREKDAKMKIERLQESVARGLCF